MYMHTQVRPINDFKRAMRGLYAESMASVKQYAEGGRWLKYKAYTRQRLLSMRVIVQHTVAMGMGQLSELVEALDARDETLPRRGLWGPMQPGAANREMQREERELTAYDHQVLNTFKSKKVKANVLRENVTEEQFMAAFDILDVNGDGTVSRKEWEEKFGPGTFDQWDRDGSGEIDREEWQEMMEITMGASIPAMQ